MNGRTDEERLLLTQRQSASRAKRHANFGWIDSSSITVPNATNSHGEVMYSTPFLAAKSICDFAGDDKMKRSAAVRYVVSMGWVPIQYKQLQLKVQKYKEGNLNQDIKWQKRRPTAKPPAKKRKTVEEDNNDFSNEDEEEFDEDIVDDSEDDFVPAPVSVSRNRRGTKRTTYTVDSDDDFEFDE